MTLSDNIQLNLAAIALAALFYQIGRDSGNKKK